MANGPARSHDGLRSERPAWRSEDASGGIRVLRIVGTTNAHLPNMTLSEKLAAPEALTELEALQGGMAAQTMKLEMQAENLEDPTLRRLVGSYVHGAMVLRDLLLRVSGAPNVVPEAVPSFEEMLMEAVLWASRWAVAQVREMRCSLVTLTASGPRSLPLEALSVFHDMADLCASGGSADAKALVKTLRNIDDALYQLIEMRDRIEHAIARRPK